METGLSVKLFVKNILLGDVKRMTYECGLHYLAFGTISVGIEFLGACNDEFDFAEKGKSKGRFNRGINDYMAQVDPAYATLNKDDFLYEQLRCGMSHLLRPQGKLALMSRRTARSRKFTHLCPYTAGSGTVMVAENFYDDFAKACGLLLEKLPEKKTPKLTQTYLPIQEFEPSLGDDIRDIASQPTTPLPTNSLAASGVSHGS